MRARTALAALVAAILAVPACAAPQVQAVLSADTRPYREAWEGFLAELGDAAALDVVGVPDSDKSFESARVIVAFGSKAALQEYPPGRKLIITMAPSVSKRGRGRTDLVHVAMTPSPRALLASLRALQPGLKSLAVVWKSEFYGDQYVPLLREAGKAIGVEVNSVEVGDDADIPDLMRSLYGRADALWLPPDPLVISEANFILFKDFSLSNRVPLYVPIPSLAERGATASVGVSFGAIGRSAARVAKQALAGEAPSLSFAEPAETVLNGASALKVGLKISPETLKSLSRVIP